MYRIESKIDIKSTEFKENKASMEQTVSLLKEHAGHYTVRGETAFHAITFRRSFGAVKPA